MNLSKAFFLSRTFFCVCALGGCGSSEASNNGSSETLDGESCKAGCEQRDWASVSIGFVGVDPENVVVKAEHVSESQTLAPFELVSACHELPNNWPCTYTLGGGGGASEFALRIEVPGAIPALYTFSDIGSRCGRNILYIAIGTRDGAIVVLEERRFDICEALDLT
jgi:hypothetical protein